MNPATEVFEGSGNVFADLGLPHAEERHTRAMLSRAIAGAIQARGLSQAQAAERLGITQPEVSAVVRGRVTGFSMDRLFRFLAALGMNVHVEVRAAGEEETGHLLVSTP